MKFGWSGILVEAERGGGKTIRFAWKRVVVDAKFRDRGSVENGREGGIRLSIKHMNFHFNSEKEGRGVVSRWE